MVFSKIDDILTTELEHCFLDFISHENGLYEKGFYRDDIKECLYRILKEGTDRWVENNENREYFNEQHKEGFIFEYYEIISDEIESLFIKTAGDFKAVTYLKESLDSKIESWHSKIEIHKIYNDLKTLEFWKRKVQSCYDNYTSIQERDSVLTVQPPSTVEAVPSFKFNPDLTTQKVKKIINYVAEEAFLLEDYSPEELINFLAGGRSIFPDFILLKKPLADSLACIEYLRTQLVHNNAHNRAVSKVDFIKLFRTEIGTVLKLNNFITALKRSGLTNKDIEEIIFR